MVSFSVSQFLPLFPVSIFRPRGSLFCRIPDVTYVRLQSVGPSAVGRSGCSTGHSAMCRDLGSCSVAGSVRFRSCPGVSMYGVQLHRCPLWSALCLTRPSWTDRLLSLSSVSAAVPGFLSLPSSGRVGRHSAVPHGSDCRRYRDTDTPTEWSAGRPCLLGTDTQE